MLPFFQVCPRLPGNGECPPFLSAVAVGVTGHGALDAVPCRADGLPGVGPGQLGLALGDVPARFEPGLYVVEAGVGILLVRLVRVAVRGIEILPAVALVEIRLVPRHAPPRGRAALRPLGFYWT